MDTVHGKMFLSDFQNKQLLHVCVIVISGLELLASLASSLAIMRSIPCIVYLASKELKEEQMTIKYR